MAGGKVAEDTVDEKWRRVLVPLLLLFGGSLWVVGGYLAGRPAEGSRGGRVLAEQATPAPTITCPPTGTPPPTLRILVEPVDSPTLWLSQTISATAAGCTEVSVYCESGTFTATYGGAGTQVLIALLPNTAHHLVVYGSLPPTYQDGCLIDAGFWGSTERDRNGGPLTIVQVWTPCCHLYLPLLER
jgi:hypothetical protein